MKIVSEQKGTLKEIRGALGLTLEKASKIIGVPVSTLSSWEHGKSFPNVKAIKKIEAAYEVNYDQIIFLV